MTVAFMTNQWINKGQGLRSRSYSPVPVSLEAYESKDSWSKSNDVAFEFRAKLASGEYQVLSVCQSEMEMVLLTAVSAASDEVKRRIAAIALAGLSDEDLLNSLKRVFAARA